MTDIDALSKAAYRNGMQPIDWAIHIAQTEIDALDLIRAEREKDPRAFPSYFLETTPAAAARRIVGGLLDAGWTPHDYGPDGSNPPKGDA